MEERIKTSDKYPIKRNNVEMEDIRSGFRLKGVLIRPEIMSASNERGRTSRFVDGIYYVVTSEETKNKERMDAFVDQNTLLKILNGEEVVVKSHLNKNIDLEWVIYRALEEVLSSSNQALFEKVVGE